MLRVHRVPGGLQQCQRGICLLQNPARSRQPRAGAGPDLVRPEGGVRAGEALVIRPLLQRVQRMYGSYLASTNVQRHCALQCSVEHLCIMQMLVAPPKTTHDLNRDAHENGRFETKMPKTSPDRRKRMNTFSSRNKKSSKTILKTDTNCNSHDPVVLHRSFHHLNASTPKNKLSPSYVCGQSAPHHPQPRRSETAEHDRTIPKPVRERLSKQIP